MNRNYDKDYELNLNGNIFRILGVKGVGANSTVYLAVSKRDGSQHILKEYNPQNLFIKKDDEGNIMLSTMNELEFEKYNSGLEKFKNAGLRQITIRNNYKALMNTTTNINCIYEAKNTVYIDMTVFEGESYDKIPYEDSIQDILLRIRAIAVAIKGYHDNGMLHLDIKPANVFILNGVWDLVFMFDFDSVVEKEELFNSDFVFSYSMNWAAPEMLNYNWYNRISEKTDIFSIGEILFYRIFKRHSAWMEQCTFFKYDFESYSLFNNVNSKLKSKLEFILHHTICVSASKRFESCAKLIENLNEAIDLAAPYTKFLISTKIERKACFIGREAEILEINQAFKEHSIVFITGMGGIGKTELAIQYAYDARTDYNEIVFVAGTGNWIEVVNNNIALQIANLDKDDFYNSDMDSIETYRYIIAVLQELVSEKTLLIIDNVEAGWFSGEQAEFGKELLKLNCNFLFTTRNEIELYTNIEIQAINDEKLLELFKYWSKDQSNEEEWIKKIFKCVGSHTLTVELLAKQIRNEGITPLEKYSQIIENGLPNLKGMVTSEKDRHVSKEVVFRHIINLFNVSNLSEEKKMVMLAGALLPIAGVNRKVFNYIASDYSGDIVADLAESGWIRISDGVSVHPLIAEVVLATIFESRYINTCLIRIKELFEKEENRPLSTYEENKDMRNAILSINENLKKADYRSKEYCGILMLNYRDRNILNIRDQLMLYEEAEKLYLAEITKEERINLWYEIAYMYIELQEFVVARSYIHQIERYIESDANKEEYKLLVRELKIEIMHDQREWKEAILECKNLLKDYKKYGSKYTEKEADLWHSLMLCYYYYGDIDNAQKCLEKSIEVFKRVEQVDSSVFLELMIEKGKFLTDKKEYLKAIQLYKKILEEPEKDPLAVTSYVSLHLVDLYLALGELNEIPKLLENAYRIRRQYYPEEHSKIVIIYRLWGEYYGYKHDWNNSDIYFEKAYELYKKIGEVDEYISDLKYAQGKVNVKGGEYTRGIAALLQSLMISEKLYVDYNQEYNAMAYQYIGIAYVGLENYVEAKRYYNKALDIYKEKKFEMGIEEIKQKLKEIL